MPKLSVSDRISRPGPKKILSLDGGGVRGVLTLSFLKRIENELRGRLGGGPDFRLSDYFDLIGGTSTGAIIAAGLALGFSVEKLQKLYLQLSREVFKKSIWKLGLFSAKFPEEPFTKALKQEFGEVAIGGEEIRTGLAIMAKRLDTASPWIIHNNPKGKYFSPEGNCEAVPNRDFLLRQVIRASTAAPTYFKPERMKVAEGMDAAFVDGGVSTFNNPALQLFLLATVKGYEFNWKTGQDDILLVSVGTGTPDLRLNPGEVMKMPALQMLGQSLLSLINDCDWQNQAILQLISKCPDCWEMDAEMGNLKDENVLSQKLLTYVRYNAIFERDWLKSNAGMELSPKQVKSLAEIDNIGNLELLAKVGEQTAERQIKAKHFPDKFDI